MSKHNLSFAENLFAGKGYFGPMHDLNDSKGAPINLLVKLALGSPIAADPNLIMDAATGAELPNTTTITYTTADDGTSPFDNVDTPVPSDVVMADGTTVNCWAFDVARNVSVNVTHGTSIVAMTVTYTGYDDWKQKVVETLTVTATGTNKTVASLKTIKYLSQIAITASADATTNTMNLGHADVLGLPYKLAAVADCLRVYFNDAIDDTATVVKADTTVATATTGDVRGTVDPTTACNGSPVVVWMEVADRATENGLRGVDQYFV